MKTSRHEKLYIEVQRAIQICTLNGKSAGACDGHAPAANQSN